MTFMEAVDTCPDQRDPLLERTRTPGAAALLALTHPRADLRSVPPDVVNVLPQLRVLLSDLEDEPVAGFGPAGAIQRPKESIVNTSASDVVTACLPENLTGDSLQTLREWMRALMRELAPLELTNRAEEILDVLRNFNPRIT
jgi:hypothetical protein